MFSNFGYYTLLMLSYALSVIIWFFIFKNYKDQLYKKEASDLPTKAWKDLLFILGLVIITILIGQLYNADLLVPSLKIGPLKLSECINHTLIFSPFLLYFMLKKPSATYSWLPTYKLLPRLAIGTLLGIFAICLFTSLGGQKALPLVLSEVYHFSNAHLAVQIFLEDLAIGILLAAWYRALGPKYFLISIVVVALIFAFGHLPTNLADGDPIGATLINRSFDAILGIGVLYSIFQSKDILWFWPIHFAMDMMQFYSGVPYH